MSFASVLFRRNWAVLWIGAIGTALAVPMLLSVGVGRAVLLLVVVIASVVAVAIPRRYLLAAAAALFCLVPVAYMSVPQLWGRFFTPAVLAIAVWSVRTLISGDRKLQVQTGLPAILIGAMITVGLYGIDPYRSLTWTTSFALAVVLPAVASARADKEDVNVLIGALAIVTFGLSVFAMVEFFTGRNLLAQIYYSAADLTQGSNWSVYRVRTTLGHPLMNALFFAPVATYFLLSGIFAREWWRLSVGLLAAVALVLTGSRGGILALGVSFGLGAILVVLAPQVRIAWKALTIVLVLVGGSLLWSNPILQDRLVTGAASFGQRSDVLATVSRVASERGLLGSGPGTAQTLFRISGIDLLIESSALQFLLGSGIIVVVFAIGWLLTASFRAGLKGRVSQLCAALAYLIMAGTFNIWDQYPGSLALLGMILIVCLAPRKANEDQSTLHQELSRNLGKTLV